MYRKLLIGILYLVTHTVVYAQTSSTSSEPTYKEDIKTVELFPVEKIYPQYIADPLRPTFSAQYQYYFDTTIIDTSDNRFDLKIGGPLPIFQLVDKSTRKPFLQFVVEAGFHGQFDAEKSEDNIGWDGIYSFYLVFQNNTNLATRIGTHHVSSHIGDELIERTGRSRINYTRQEIRAGISWTFLPKSQVYVDAGWAYDLRNESLQEAWRTQVGVQYQQFNLGTLLKKPLGWYAALDLSSYEENNWDINTTLQAGFVTPSHGRYWRFGLEYYDGRGQIGEFFQDKERYISVGIWVDI